MSGGHFNYGGAQIRAGLKAVAQDEEAARIWPHTTAMMLDLAEVLSAIEHDIDWQLSGDTEDCSSDLALAHKILHAVLAAAPDEWFPRGKWATIQAIEQRATDGKP